MARLLAAGSSLRWVVTRLGEAAVTLFFLTIVSFSVVALAPGDPTLSLLRIDEVQVSQEDIAALREELGLNDPLYQRYGDYLGGVVQGDLGTSLMTGKPVLSELMKAFPATLILSGVTLLATTVVVLTLGAIAARYRHTLADKAIMGLCYIGASMPTFWLGLVLINLFAVKLSVLPASGWRGGVGLILPVIALVIAIAPPFIKIFRNRFVELNDENFVRAARARGLHELRIAYGYITRGALIPVVTMLGVSLGHLLSGSVVAEVVFGLPGVGKLVVEAIARRDYAVIQGFILAMGVVVLVVMLAVDILNRLIDPSLRLKEQERG